MPISDTPMTYLEFRAIRAQVLRELKLKPTDWIQLLAPTVDSTGTPQNLLNTSAQITEATAATQLPNVASNTSQSYLDSRVFSSHIGFGNLNAASSSTVANNLQRRVLAVAATTNAGGDASGNLVAALAGYQGCVCLQRIFALGTDGAWDLTISSTSGVAPPLVLTGLASTANTIGPDWEEGLFIQGTADNEAITYTIANGGNTLTYWFLGYYWYET